MKRLLDKIALTTASLLLWSCSSSIDDPTEGSGAGEGSVILSAAFLNENGTDADYADQLAQNCTIYIYNDQGRIRTYNGINQIPQTIWLMSGQYAVEAWTGDSVSASFTAKYYRGYKPFTVTTGEPSNVSLNCPLANVVVSVSYDSTVKDALNSYTLKVYHKRGALTFDGDDNRKGYFMMPNGVSDLAWTLTAETFDGKEFIKSGVINNVKSATEYKLHFNYSGTITPQGGATFDLSVDKTEIDVYHNLVINAAPTIALDGLDISSTLQYERGKSRRHPVTIVAPSGLSSVTMSSQQFKTLGFTADSYQLVNPADSTITALYSKGINIATQHDDNGSDAMVVNFSAKLCNLLPVGDYKIDFCADDKNGKSTQASLMIKIVEPTQQ